MDARHGFNCFSNLPVHAESDDERSIGKCLPFQDSGIKHNGITLAVVAAGRPRTAFLDKYLELNAT